MSTNTSARPVRRSVTLSYRFGVLLRFIAALLGGYAVCALFSLAIALMNRTAPREEAIALGSIPAFLAFAGCIIWAFTAATATRAWLGIGATATALGIVVWLKTAQ